MKVIIAIRSGDMADAQKWKELTQKLDLNLTGSDVSEVEMTVDTVRLFL